jgi:hypothetical protein
MPLDDTYTPEPESTFIHKQLRVMTLDELAPEQRRTVEDAIRKFHQKKDPGQAGVVKSMQEWYCSWNGAIRDFYISAQKGADVTGDMQRIHFHAYGLGCEGFEHAIVEPDPIRHAALTR